MCVFRLSIAALILLAIPRSLAADPDPELKLFGTVDGVELWFAINRPYKGCTYGSIRNRSQDDVEVRWGYEARSQSGALRSEAEAPDSPWPVGAGSSVGGWAAILWCPFNKNFGAAQTEAIALLRLTNIRVRNVGAERREKERLAQEEEARKKREQEEKERLAKQEEENRRREEETRKRQEEERNRHRDAEERARVAEAERQRRIAQGFQDLNAAQDANRKMGDSSAAVAGAMFAVEGGNEGSATTTRALRLGFGFGGRFLPHMSNTTGSDVVEESTTSTGGGFAFDGSFEYWPRYLKKYGVGIGAAGGLAGMALPGGAMYSLNAGAGVKAYYGDRSRWTIRGELELAGRIVGSSANLFGAIVSGSGSYSLWRLGIGPGFCKTASAAGMCETSYYALLLLDWTSIGMNDGMGRPSTGDRRGTLLRFGAISKYAPRGMGIEIDLGFGYPAPGETKYSIQPGDEDRAGLYFAFSLRKAWTWHSGGASR